MIIIRMMMIIIRTYHPGNKILLKNLITAADNSSGHMNNLESARRVYNILPLTTSLNQRRVAFPNTLLRIYISCFHNPYRTYADECAYLSVLFQGFRGRMSIYRRKIIKEKNKV